MFILNYGRRCSSFTVVFAKCLILRLWAELWLHFDILLKTTSTYFSAHVYNVLKKNNLKSLAIIKRHEFYTWTKLICGRHFFKWIFFPSGRKGWQLFSPQHIEKVGENLSFLKLKLQQLLVAWRFDWLETMSQYEYIKEWKIDTVLPRKQKYGSTV